MSSNWKGYVLLGAVPKGFYKYNSEADISGACGFFLFHAAKTSASEARTALSRVNGHERLANRCIIHVHASDLPENDKGASHRHVLAASVADLEAFAKEAAASVLDAIHLDELVSHQLPAALHTDKLKRRQQITEMLIGDKLHEAFDISTVRLSGDIVDAQGWALGPGVTVDTKQPKAHLNIHLQTLGAPVRTLRDTALAACNARVHIQLLQPPVGMDAEEAAKWCDTIQKDGEPWQQFIPNYPASERAQRQRDVVLRVLQRLRDLGPASPYAPAASSSGLDVTQVMKQVTDATAKLECTPDKLKTARIP